MMIDDFDQRGERWVIGNDQGVHFDIADGGQFSPRGFTLLDI